MSASEMTAKKPRKKKPPVGPPVWKTLSPAAWRKYKENLFEPSREVRALDFSRLIGETVQVQLGHANQETTDQYATISPGLVKRLCGTELHLSGWLGKFLGPQGGAVKLKIIDAYMTGHRNGGRQNKNRLSYKEFFDEEQKRLVQGALLGGLEMRLLAGGFDYYQADVVVKFEGGLKIDSLTFGLTSPEEWYSELYAGDSRFQFADGFFDTAEQASNHFGQQSVDDLFGTRFFPVGVYPLSIKVDKIRSVLYTPKSHSKPVLLSDRVVFGTRCKPDEYDTFIRETYEIGGVVPRNVTWDWS
jgi:hypothetical protein